MLARKIQNVESVGAPTVVACDAGCITNIEGGLHRKGLPQRVVHIAEVLSQAGSDG
jgi:L-lactate dehydrogenase complex protein LldE